MDGVDVTVLTDNVGILKSTPMITWVCSNSTTSLSRRTGSITLAWALGEHARDTRDIARPEIDTLAEETANS
jgi:hypothetical protein